MLILSWACCNSYDLNAIDTHRGQLLNSLMKQCEQGTIKGIHGRLGDLGTIDEKYDVAISTACAALDDIVVDTMQTAVQCVEFLKKHNLGSATFIALDKVILSIISNVLSL